MNTPAADMFGARDVDDELDARPPLLMAADVTTLDARTAAGQADMCLDVLPDVSAIFVDAATGDLAAVRARAEVLCSFLTARVVAIWQAHPDVDLDAYTSEAAA